MLTAKKLIQDSLQEDISQIQSLIKILNESENLIMEIQNDLDNVNFNLNEDNPMKSDVDLN